MSQEAFITASGGTETTCGDYKIHKFLATGPLNVTALSCCSSNDKVSYMVVAGGGGGPGSFSAGGGAGGYREGKWATDPYTASPLAAPNTLFRFNSFSTGLYNNVVPVELLVQHQELHPP